MSQSEISACAEQVLQALPWLLEADPNACKEASNTWIRVTGSRWLSDVVSVGASGCWTGTLSQQQLQAKRCCDEAFMRSGLNKY